MAKNSITDYSKTAASNTDIQSVDIDEGCLPSGINNAIRELMADLADMNDGTVSLTSPSFAAATVTGALASGSATVGSTTSSAAVHSYTKLEIESSSHGALQLSGSTGAEQWIWFADDSSSTPVGGITYYHGGPYMAFRVEGSERMRIDSGGNAIFTKSGGAYLQLKDASAVRGSINVETSDGLVFTTGSSFAERMRIDSSGRVGIGTSSPSAPLHVVGNSYVQSGTFYTDAISAYSGSSISINAGSSHLAATVNGSERMRIDSSGNVGIGTTSPTSKISLHDFAGNAYISQTNPANSQRLEIGNAYSLYSGASGAVSAIASNDTLAFATSDAERMRINSSGNVGIGNSSPDTNLEISDTSGAVLRLSGHTGGVVNVTPYDIGSIEFKSDDTSSGAQRVVATVKTEADTSSTIPGGELVFETCGASSSGSLAERMRIDSSGRVGIGVTPSYNLQMSVGSGSPTSGSHFKFVTGSDGYGGGVQSKHYYGVVFIGTTGTSQRGLRFSTNELGPATGTVGNGFTYDNVMDLGGSSNRWDDVRATNGTIQTSDQTLKQDISSLTDAEITAAKAISRLFKTFKWIDKVEAKGDDARTHTGVIAQEVQQAMTDTGLDATKYAFWCSDTWWEAEVTYEDENGDEHTGIADFKTIEEAPEGATEVTRLSIRYPELLAFIGAATEQRLTDIETRLTALEN